MLSKMNKSKLLTDYKSVLDILEGNIALFHEGNSATYRVIATQLSILLVGEQALVRRLFKTPALHPLKGYISKEEDEAYIKKFGHSFKDGLVFSSPARIDFDGKGWSKIVALFDERREPLEIDIWLNQPLFNDKITIRELIKSIRDKEGAHADKKYNKTLEFTKSVSLIDKEIHEQYIAAIGEYVLKSLRFINSQLGIE